MFYVIFLRQRNDRNQKYSVALRAFHKKVILWNDGGDPPAVRDEKWHTWKLRKEGNRRLEPRHFFWTPNPSYKYSASAMKRSNVKALHFDVWCYVLFELLCLDGKKVGTGRLECKNKGTILHNWRPSAAGATFKKSNPEVGSMHEKYTAGQIANSLKLLVGQWAN